MILINATIKYKGYDPNSLKPKSNKRICYSCDECGRVRYVNNSQYRDLCLFCSSKKRGINNMGWHHSIKTKQKQSNAAQGKYVGKLNPAYGRNQLGKNNYHWKGGYDKKRPWVLPEMRCIKLNNRFKGSEFHHITKSIGIYILKELHYHIKPHSLKTGLNMDKINLLSLQYLGCEL